MHNESFYGRAPDYIIQGYRLYQTCGGCPEQYDVWRHGQQCGYLRLRHGYFRADYPQCGGETVFEAEPRGDGVFEPEERQDWLQQAIAAIKARHEKSTS